jgi:site-specific DNA-methyltransferase (adenine-specific)
MIELNKLYFEDCLEGMKKIDDKSIDLVLIDPPYGLTAPKWDSIVSFNSLWKEFNRIGKKGYIAAIFGCQPFTTNVISSNLNNFKYCWYWNKNQGTNFFHAKRMPIRKVEEISIFGGKAYNPQITDGHVKTNSAKGCSNGKAYHGTNTRNYVGGKTTRFPDNILNFKCVDNYSRKHSSQKPKSAIYWFRKQLRIL